MFKLMEQIRSRRQENKEFGGADIIVFLFVFPLLFFTILTIIEFGLHLQVRSQIQGVARDGARLTAMYGGSNKDVRLNSSGKSVSTYMMDRLWDPKTSSCKLSNCTKKPTKVTCTPGRSLKFGTEVVCSVTYFYKPAVNSFMFGLEGVVSPKNGLVFKEHSVTETGY